MTVAASPACHPSCPCVRPVISVCDSHRITHVSPPVSVRQANDICVWQSPRHPRVIFRVRASSQWCLCVTVTASPMCHPSCPCVRPVMSVCDSHRVTRMSSFVSVCQASDVCVWQSPHHPHVIFCVRVSGQWCLCVTVAASPTCHPSCPCVRPVMSVIDSRRVTHMSPLVSVCQASDVCVWQSPHHPHVTPRVRVSGQWCLWLTVAASPTCHPSCPCVRPVMSVCDSRRVTHMSSFVSVCQASDVCVWQSPRHPCVTPRVRVSGQWCLYVTSVTASPTCHALCPCVRPVTVAASPVCHLSCPSVRPVMSVCHSHRVTHVSPPVSDCPCVRPVTVATSPVCHP